MRSYALSFGAGLLVGMVYVVLRTKSPAPPIIALVGLLGMVVGEKAATLVTHGIWPIVRDWWS